MGDKAPTLIVSEATADAVVSEPLHSHAIGQSPINAKPGDAKDLGRHVGGAAGAVVDGAEASRRLKQWYGLHFPELAEIVHDAGQYARVVRVIGDRKRLSEDPSVISTLTSILDDSKVVQTIIFSAKTSRGSAYISPNAMEQVQQMATRVIASTVWQSNETLNDGVRASGSGMDGEGSSVIEREESSGSVSYGNTPVLIRKLCISMLQSHGGSAGMDSREWVKQSFSHSMFEYSEKSRQRSREAFVRRTLRRAFEMLLHLRDEHLDTVDEVDSVLNPRKDRSKERAHGTDWGENRHLREFERRDFVVRKMNSVIYDRRTQGSMSESQASWLSQTVFRLLGTDRSRHDSSGARKENIAEETEGFDRRLANTSRVYDATADRILTVDFSCMLTLLLLIRSDRPALSTAVLASHMQPATSTSSVGSEGRTVSLSSHFSPLMQLDSLLSTKPLTSLSGGLYNSFFSNNLPPQSALAGSHKPDRSAHRQPPAIADSRTAESSVKGFDWTLIADGHSGLEGFEGGDGDEGESIAISVLDDASSMLSGLSSGAAKPRVSHPSSVAGESSRTTSSAQLRHAYTKTVAGASDEDIFAEWLWRSTFTSFRPSQPTDQVQVPRMGAQTLSPESDGDTSVVADVMLVRECVLAMQGVSGRAFVEAEGENGGVYLEVADGIRTPLLSWSSTRRLLVDFMEAGNTFRRLHAFVVEHTADNVAVAGVVRSERSPLWTSLAATLSEFLRFYAAAIGHLPEFIVRRKRRLPSLLELHHRSHRLRLQLRAVAEWCLLHRRGPHLSPEAVLQHLYQKLAQPLASSGEQRGLQRMLFRSLFRPIVHRLKEWIFYGQLAPSCWELSSSSSTTASGVEGPDFFVRRRLSAGGEEMDASNDGDAYWTQQYFVHRRDSTHPNTTGNGVSVPPFLEPLADDILRAGQLVQLLFLNRTPHGGVSAFFSGRILAPLCHKYEDVLFGGLVFERERGGRVGRAIENVFSLVANTVDTYIEGVEQKRRLLQGSPRVKLSIAEVLERAHERHLESLSLHRQAENARRQRLLAEAQAAREEVEQGKQKVLEMELEKERKREERAEKERKAQEEIVAEERERLEKEFEVERQRAEKRLAVADWKVKRLGRESDLKRMWESHQTKLDEIVRISLDWEEDKPDELAAWIESAYDKLYPIDISDDAVSKPSEEASESPPTPEAKETADNRADVEQVVLELPEVEVEDLGDAAEPLPESGEIDDSPALPTPEGLDAPAETGSSDTKPLQRVEEPGGGDETAERPSDTADDDRSNGESDAQGEVVVAGVDAGDAFVETLDGVMSDYAAIVSQQYGSESGDFVSYLKSSARSRDTHGESGYDESFDIIVGDLPVHEVLRSQLYVPMRNYVRLLNRAAVYMLRKERGLDSHIEAIRKLYLFGSGDILDSLSTRLFETFDSSAKSISITKLNGILYSTFRDSPRSSTNAFTAVWVEEMGSGYTAGGGEKSGVDTELRRANMSWILRDQREFLQRLRFSTDETTVPQNEEVSRLDVLDPNVSLEYSIGFPLNVIASKPIMHKLNGVFRFLLRMKRVENSLLDVFATFQVLKTTDACMYMQPRMRRLMMFRHEVQHFVTIFRGYVMNQVIEVSWTEFYEKYSAAATVDELREAISAWVQSIEERCLLQRRARSVMTVIDTILSSVLTFKDQLHAFSIRSNVDVPDTLWQQFEHTMHVFHESTKFLLIILRKLVQKGYQTHMRDLLLRMNFNGFHESSLRETGNAEMGAKSES